MTRTIKTIVAATAALAPLLPATAHGIYLTQRSRQMILVYGEGADDSDMIRREPLVESVAAYDADYAPIQATKKIAGLAMVVEPAAKPAVVTAILNNGVWSRMEGGAYEKKGLDEMPGAKISGKNVKYTVAIVGALTKPLAPLPGQALQIVPVGAIPALLGQKLKYQVLYEGKPVAGARLINDFINDPDAKEVVSGKDGTVTFPVRNQGLNVIRAVYEGPSDNPTKYRMIEHTATLSFWLQHKPE